MSNYTKTTNFATKDNLSPGNPLKIVKGTEIDTEYNNIATAVGTKTDNASAAITGGTITGITDLAVADGGTGASTAANARSNLSAAASGANSDITSLTGLTTPLTIAQGGTTASTAAGARTSLGLVIGTDVLAPNGSAASLTSFPTFNQNTTGNAATVTTNANLTGAVTSVGNASSLGSFSSAQLLGALTDETGTGSAVFATSPTLITPALGTPSALVGTNITGTAAGLTAGNVTTNANLTGGVTSVGNAATVVTNANLTGAVTSSGNATSLGSFSSANLLGALTDETGTGVAVFATSPVLVTPNLGTPSAAVLTSATGLPLTTGVTGLLPVANGGTATATPSIVAGTNITVTGSWPNQTVTASGGSGTVTSIDVSGGTTGLTTSGGPVTSSGTVTLAGTLAVANGGSGQTSYTNGQLLIGNTTGNTLTKATLTAGTGITITNGTGSISIAASGGGDVAGPASSTANGIALFDGTTGKLLKDSSATDGLIHGLTVGRGAGAVSTNTVLGTSAYQANTTGSHSVVVGNQAGYTNSTGIQNVFIGHQAGYFATGRDSTFVGTGAGGAITSGTNNTIIGQYDGNGDGLDIRTASNYAVISDGDGNRLLSTANGQTLALDSAVPNSGTGITFPATQSASSDANTLDDYEEGTFTVTTNGDGTGAFSAQTGEYTKIGNICIVRIIFSVSTNFTSSGIGGLPFTVGGSSSTSNIGFVGSVITSSSNESPVTAQAEINGTAVYLFVGSNNGNAHEPNTTNATYRLSIVYRTS